MLHTYKNYTSSSSSSSSSIVMDSSPFLSPLTLKPPSSSFNYYHPLLHSTNSFYFFSTTLLIRPPISCSQSHTTNSDDSQRNSPSFSFPFSQTIKKVATFPRRTTTHNNSSRDSDEDCCYYLQQNGGLGVAILSVTTNAAKLWRISPFVATLAANPTFVSAFVAWFVAQSTKVFLNFFFEKKWDFSLLFASGGMPSSHSALCTALTTSVAICHGVADSLFPVCLGFSSIVMYDAIGVRRHAGMQAQVLNMIVADMFQEHPISERKLKELLGHTPSQVFAGALLGFLIACFCCQASVVGA